MAELIFSFEMTDFDEIEISDRGYITGVGVRLSSGLLYDVMFYDIVRLGQDLEAKSEAGNCFVAEPGMVVLEKLTLEGMRRAVNKLEAQKFFEKMVPR